MATSGIATARAAKLKNASLSIVIIWPGEGLLSRGPPKVCR